MLCKLVKAESTSIEELKHDYPELSEKEMLEEHYKETVSIASVTLKRTFTEEYFPNDLTEVIFQKNQYATANADNEEIYHCKEANVRVIVEESDITEDIMKAVDDALDGKDSTVEYVTDGAIFFYSDKYISQTERDKRANVKEKIKFGNTVFYR